LKVEELEVGDEVVASEAGRLTTEGDTVQIVSEVVDKRVLAGGCILSLPLIK